jgi:hypothetical protein
VNIARIVARERRRQSFVLIVVRSGPTIGNFAATIASYDRIDATCAAIFVTSDATVETRAGIESGTGIPVLTSSR